ncbi:alpha amylase N-terminal ig-like domain-containing protein, partial [Leptospira santarosai]|nr:alpha amylase N-terminal ig-like domain-containing protein [Leptospira santarosai]
FDYWEVKISPPHRRIRYGFELFSNEERVIFTEKDFMKTSFMIPAIIFVFLTFMPRSNLTHQNG